MTRALWLAALWLCAAPAGAADDNDPQTRCGADWRPAFTFVSGETRATPQAQNMARDVVRLARGCRYRTLRVVAFVRGDLDLAQRRANWIRQALVEDHWPLMQIDFEFRPKRRAPQGQDGPQAFTADAIIEFADPDPNWRERPRPTMMCTDKPGAGSVCTPRPPPEPRWISEPWPSLGIHMPMAFFASGDATLTASGRIVVDEGARRFLSANCRVLPVTGFADMAEADPVDISGRRAQAVRDELVRFGVTPDAALVYGRGTASPIVPTAPGVPEPQNRRAEMDCAD